MSVEATRAVWRYSESTGTARLVLLAIADNADDAGIAWPSHKTIAEKCHIGHRTVIRNIQQLEDIRELGVIHRRNRGNVYLIVLPDLSDVHVKHHQQSGNKCRYCTLANVTSSATYVPLGALNVSPTASYVSTVAHEPLEPSKNHQELGARARKNKCGKCQGELDEDRWCSNCEVVWVA